MSTSSPEAADASAIRRASGRVRKQPEAYTSSPFSSGKRKRSNEEDGEGDVQMPDDYVSDEDVPSGDDEPAEEEVREQNRKSRKPKSAAPKKPAQKKPKMNGTTLPIRSATVGTKKKRRAPKKTAAAVAEDAEEAGGLYAQVFASADSMETITAQWLRDFDAHESHGLADVVTFVLKCAGCNSTVTDYDVEDPDGATNRLIDLQDEYQATDPTDYPLVGKGKAGAAFKEDMASFLNTLIKTIAAKGVLYSNATLIENVEVWFSTMSSAANRAFRHTATVASLSVMTALCEVAAERANEVAATRRQADTERRRPNFNRGRVRQLDQKVRDAGQAQDFIEIQLKDWFDTVFIHRYRDIDPVIRRECASALGDWITILPSVYFDGQHLRYLGWVLSDSVAATRAEVIKQLHRLYKEGNKIGGLETFTERFRSRLVEIGTRDAESNVRSAGIELLDLLRENGLLEPDDVDAVGRLVYDSDVRARKALAKFFAENVADLFNSKIDDLGGLESLEETLPEVGEGNFETPRLEWLKFKALAETMVAYDTDDSLPSQVERNRGDGSLTLHAAATESRYTLAADALYDKLDEMKDWQALSGYLLFDHSFGRANGVANDPLSQLKHEAVLTEKEEFILLELVSSSVKRRLRDIQEKSTSTKSKLTKKQKELLTDEQEEAARHLASLIPKLLKKFGDVPNTAAAVLRMERVLSMHSLHVLHEDATTYGALLDDVRKQFMSHGSDEVLDPASKAIQHAKSYMELDDLTDEKLATLWEDVVNNLVELISPETITVRGTYQTDELGGLSNNLLRIIRLSQVSNCIPALEDSNVASNTEAGVEYHAAIDYIVALIERAIPSKSPTADLEDAALEDEVAARAAEAALRYLQWNISLIIQTVTSGVSTEMPYEELEALAKRRDAFVTNVHSVLQSRKAGEAISVTMSSYLLEIFTSAVVLKTINVKPGMRDDWDVLVQNMGPSYSKSIMKVFSAAEKNFATLTGKKLEDAGPADAEIDVDAEPLDEDPLSDSESEDEDAEPTQTQASQQRKETKQRNTILAEKTLCELTRSLIYAVHAGVVDKQSTRKRLERNKMKLGQNFKEMCFYLEIGNAKKGTKAKARPKGKAVNLVAAKAKSNPKSNAIVAEDELDDEIEDADGEDEETLRRQGLVVDGEDAGAEQEDVDGAGGDAEAESVLGD
ncbi:cohesin complex subunit [Vermiconidia calcicola]|uniref:Cohesin complex subunit n=1 Tax=Vermiconidia calcicola TaxID=1690605 RepID=A0ACC3N814_9PEZI|nr:cohesin complex subunit [Vermiconidia calcicola]